MSVNERQVGGMHYQSEYQHWDFVHDVDLGYLEAQVVKYISRWRKKGGMQDLQKAEHFVEKLQNLRQFYLNSAHEYADYNGLSYEERFVIINILNGSYDAAKFNILKLMEECEASEPTSAYVDQD